MTYGEKAKELKDTLNCAQSVVVALDELTGLDEKTSKALSTGMGGGLRCGEACGAFAGAVLSLGLTVGKDGRGKPGQPAAVACKQLADEFKAKFGAIRCKDLLDAAGGDHSVCNGFCAWCADRVAELAAEAGKAE